MCDTLFTGACTALVTPFLDGHVNFPMLERLLQRQCDAGIEAVVICGTTGEAPTLSDNEKLMMFERAKKFVGNDCKIIAGTGSNSTQHTIGLSRAAQECGVDGLLVVTPYYNKTTADGLYAHYIAVSEAVDLPVIIYNVPSRTGMDASVSVYRRLSSISNVVGIKEASTDITKITKTLHACGSELTVWSGNDDMTVPMMSLGAKGVISVLSNIAPVETQAMASAALSGDFDTAAALQIQLQPLIELLFCEVNPIPVKEAMRLIGFDCGSCRMPLCEMTRDNQKKLEKFLIS